ncbi:MAG: crotonase/enoyl-CoA hydratase family protein [Myxococcota bacterium]|nr:crotonase/enoyl-CoA hydratase family protein [Myxococcota bacterium]MDW8363147.1 crotonase/enoyl-CoA hydratase family protein [Myxococcales bacterium]
MDEGRARVQVERNESIAIVRLDRPERRNALDLPMFEALVAAGRAVGADPSVRAVVLVGSGPSFCSGLDVRAFTSGTPEHARRLFERDPDSPATLAQRAAWVWQEIDVPVIAALHGAVYGAGLQIALGADLRVATADARLAAMEIEWGLVPDMGLSVTLPSLVRADVARELVWTGRVVTGIEAERLGLVTRIAGDSFAEALGVARDIAARSPDAVRASKRLLRDAARRSVAEALAIEAELQRALVGSANQLEAVAARLQGRTPRFVDPGS